MPSSAFSLTHPCRQRMRSLPFTVRVSIAAMVVPAARLPMSRDVCSEPARSFALATAVYRGRLRLGTGDSGPLWTGSRKSHSRVSPPASISSSVAGAVRTARRPAIARDGRVK